MEPMLIAVIPARGGSKGVLNKNLRHIGTLSLVQISANFALTCKAIDKVFVSTDSTEIAKEFLQNHEETLFENLKEGRSIPISEKLYLHKRKKSQAQDNSKTVETVMDIIENEKIDLNDLMLLLQPTSPFREQIELNKIIELMIMRNADSCVSAKLFDSPHPAKAFKLGPEMMLNTSVYEKLSSPRQELDSYFVLDGSFYLTKVSAILQNKSLLAPTAAIYLRSGLRTINIDNEDDMKIASIIASSNLFS